MPSATRIELYDGDAILELDAKHRYSADVKGAGPRAVPGTTGITGVIDKSGALVGWAKNQVLDYIRERVVFDSKGAFVLDHKGARLPLDEIQLATLLQEAKYADKRKTEKAATIGTTVHEWVERHIKLILDGHAKQLPAPRNKTVLNGVSAFLQWEAANKVEYIFSERQVLSIKHWFAGTLDILAVVNGKLSVVDIKTTSGVYDEMFLQTAAYVIALEEEFGEKIEQRIIVHLNRDTGVVTPHPVDQEGPGIEADTKGFLGARDVFFRLKGL